MDKPKVVTPNPNIIINRKGLGFFGALTILLIVLKILGYNVPGWWIVAAFLGPIILLGVIVLGVLIFFLGCFVVAIAIDLYDDRQFKRHVRESKRINKRK